MRANKRKKNRPQGQLVILAFVSDIGATLAVNPSIVYRLEQD